MAEPSADIVFYEVTQDVVATAPRLRPEDIARLRYLLGMR
jgi:hypothetical protein